MATKGEILAAYANGEGTLARIGDDEPIFILRAQDRYAAKAVARWAEQQTAVSYPGSASREKALQARGIAAEMEAWRAAHGDGKVPD